MLPGSSAGWNSFWSVFLTYQSRMRPTNGDIRVTFASAHATAWGKRKGKLQIKYHWLCVCSYAHLMSLRQKLVCNKMLQILGLIYNSLKGNAVCGSWHLLCLNRGDIHMFIGVFILLCNPLSIQNALCSQNVYYFKSKGKITWANEKRRVMLQWIPSCSSFLKSTHCGELKILKKLFH